jgi:hypothetical protein
MITDYGSDLPSVNLFGRETTTKIRGIGASYSYSMQEARAAMLAGLPLDARKAAAARHAIEQKIDDVICVGNTDDFGITLSGLFTLSGTETYANPNGAAGSPTWALKTPDEILEDLHGMARQVHTNSKGIESPDNMVMPLDSYGLISTRRMGDGDARTILAKFLADDPHVKTVNTSHRLSSNSGWSGRRVVCYRKDPNKLEALIPQEFEQFAPQFDGMIVKTNCHARVGGVILYFPKSVIYCDGV